MKSLFLISVVLSGTSFAGGTGGTGTPPAVMEEMVSLMAKDADFMAVTPSDLPAFLLTNKPLTQSMKISANGQDVEAFRISRTDLTKLTNFKNVDVVNPVDDSIGSYRIEDGAVLDTYVLTDRRELARNAVLRN